MNDIIFDLAKKAIDTFGYEGHVSIGDYMLKITINNTTTIRVTVLSCTRYRIVIEHTVDGRTNIVSANEYDQDNAYRVISTWITEQADSVTNQV